MDMGRFGDMERAWKPHAFPRPCLGSHPFPGLHLQSETSDSLRLVSCWSQLTQLKEGRRSLEVLAGRLKRGGGAVWRD